MNWLNIGVSALVSLIVSGIVSPIVSARLSQKNLKKARLEDDTLSAVDELDSAVRRTENASMKVVSEFLMYRHDNGLANIEDNEKFITDNSSLIGDFESELVRLEAIWRKYENRFFDDQIKEDYKSFREFSEKTANELSAIAMMMTEKQKITGNHSLGMNTKVSFDLLNDLILMRKKIVN